MDSAPKRRSPCRLHAAGECSSLTPSRPSVSSTLVYRTGASSRRFSSRTTAASQVLDQVLVVPPDREGRHGSLRRLASPPCASPSTPVRQEPARLDDALPARGLAL